jgi:hypothetical protein
LHAFSTGEPAKNIYHDPHKGKPGLEGQESKALTIAPGTRGVKEMYLNLTARRQGQPEQRINVSLSAAEMEVVKSIIIFALPRLLGFDEQFLRDGVSDELPQMPTSDDWKAMESSAPPSSAPF